MEVTVLETSEILANAEDRLMDEAVAELEQRHSRTKAANTEGRRHLQDLFELVVRCVRDGDADPIVSSSHQLAADRFAAGSDIGEVQGEFNVLEEVLWREVAATLAGDQRIEALELMNTILRAGRDALARTYVALASGRNTSRGAQPAASGEGGEADRKSTRLNSSHLGISYAVF